jgi:hypothetical protein
MGSLRVKFTSVCDEIAFLSSVEIPSRVKWRMGKVEVLGVGLLRNPVARARG